MSEKSERGQKRSKAYYKKCAYGAKKQRLNSNVLEPGIRGFLVMCNHNEKCAVRESYNILNEYAGIICGSKPAVEELNSVKTQADDQPLEENITDEDDDDIEKALKKEVEGIKAAESSNKRFQNVLTKAKNCVFIRTTLDNPVEIVTYLMKDIAQRKLKRARFAARILPITGTCKANTSDIEKLASEVLQPIFSPSKEDVPKSYTILFKSRNNNGSSCGRDGVVSSLIKVVKCINPEVKFTWSEYSVAVLVEIVCTVCCIGVAPDYIRLRKYNLQELSKGAKTEEISEDTIEKNGSACKNRIEDAVCKDRGEDAEYKEKSEDTECKDRIEDAECKTRSEDVECIDRSEDTEFKNRIVNVECKDRSEDTECKDRIENVECKDRSEDTEFKNRIVNVECKDRSEDTECKDRIENVECKHISEDTECKDRIENVECKHTSEDTECKDRIENVECKNKSEDTECKDRIENVECKQTSEDIECKDRIENVECKNRSEDTEFKDRIENVECKDRSEDAEENATENLESQVTESCQNVNEK